MPINNAKSLNLLKENALKADFNVATRVFQKFISKKEVNPINSQPKNKIKKFPEFTKISILITKELIKIIKRSIKGSYLK